MLNGKQAATAEERLCEIADEEAEINH